jgi:heme-degrading monooxygenase HmoA
MLEMQVKAGREAEFEDVWRAIAAKVRAEPDNRGQALLRPQTQPRTFVIVSDWATEASFRAFEKSPAQAELTAPLRELRESVKMTLHEVVLVVEPGSPS